MILGDLLIFDEVGIFWAGAVSKWARLKLEINFLRLIAYIFSDASGKVSAPNPKTNVWVDLEVSRIK